MRRHGGDDESARASNSNRTATATAARPVATLAAPARPRDPLQSADPSSPPPVNQQLIRSLADLYTIEREVGRGGMATVYLALEARRRVAVKVLHPEQNLPGLVRRLSRSKQP